LKVITRPSLSGIVLYSAPSSSGTAGAAAIDLRNTSDGPRFGFRVCDDFDLGDWADACARIWASSRAGSGRSSSSDCVRWSVPSSSSASECAAEGEEPV
jgi:hypothetical protein